MNAIHKRRLYFLSIFALGMAIAASLILYALKKNINVFLTPSQINAQPLPENYHFRLGGMVKKGSVVHDKQGLGVTFIVSDLKQEITVRYIGVLPDLFKEGTGVIADGNITAQHIFIANQVLAKHDEKYMPRISTRSKTSD
jgi:cytochrome c-type biogenesis protein CcmE